MARALWAVRAKIHFAHRTFKWTNEAPGVAAVHVVIIGWALHEAEGKRPLFEYEDVRGEPHRTRVSNINPYLVEAPDVVVTGRRSAISDDAPPMSYGSMPIDKGHLTLSPEEAAQLNVEHPEAAEYVRRYVGGREVLNGLDRFCLWLEDCPPQLIRQNDFIRERVSANRAYRLSSSRNATNKLATTPALFGEIRQPESRYLIVPKVSSERCDYMPIAFMEPQTIASGSVLIVPRATPYHFGVLSSAMHMAWMRYTAGRMKSDYQYSAGIVYNNFPWPEVSEKRRQRVTEAAEAVLAARSGPLAEGATLADCYGPLAMPPPLAKAHRRRWGRAVDFAYRPQAFPDEARSVAFLFDRYEALTNALFAS